MSGIRTMHIIFSHCEQNCKNRHLKYNFLYYKKLFVIFRCYRPQVFANYECNEKMFSSHEYFVYTDGNPIEIHRNMYLDT